MRKDSFPVGHCRKCGRPIVQLGGVSGYVWFHKNSNWDIDSDEMPPHPMPSGYLAVYNEVEI